MPLEQFSKSELAKILVDESNSPNHDQLASQMIDMLSKFKGDEHAGLLIVSTLKNIMFPDNPLVNELSLEDLPEIARIVKLQLGKRS